MASAAAAADDSSVLLSGKVVDADSGRIIPCRLSIDGPDGSQHFAASGGGTAVRYDRKRFERRERGLDVRAPPHEDRGVDVPVARHHRDAGLGGPLPDRRRGGA